MHWLCSYDMINDVTEKSKITILQYDDPLKFNNTISLEKTIFPPYFQSSLDNKQPQMMLRLGNF